MSLKKATLFIILILLIDQLSKIYIKTHFVLGEDVEVFTWFKIFFVENKGMAWGTKLNDIFPFLSENTAKVSLTIFRIFAILGVGYWLYKTISSRGPKVLVTALIFIMAGAIGNIIDSIFYGVLFSSSNTQVATFLGKNSYAPLLHGQVVDMLYLPIWNGYLPKWIPFIGGDFFTFFEPVFNIADVSICIGFIILIFWNKTAFSKSTKEE
ncbi:lipoprotein signal peptidase [Aurantibacter aestuarii]|uniref:Lipoprotein signal peptidase n=1 Tax=Aurantibacter aestuarii TaxID=1266046 RepID=A0A2T1ND59_9FLAO|nr:lipoprotein signal peptidase [Aurantibacter aestuarii]PSG90356.1 lipoprotein signal peptidase [Aurantibacter aestuarii]